MISLRRRKRQAQENTEGLLLAVLERINNDKVFCEKSAELHNIDELDQLIQDVEPATLDLAQSLYPDWAIPIVLQTIGELYYGKYKQFSFSGIYYKRAVAYLWQKSFDFQGRYKNVSRLEELVCRCYVVETLYSYRKMFFAIPNFWFSFQNGQAVIPDIFYKDIQEFGMLAYGRGRRLRVAESNTQLMNQFSEQFMQGIVDVLYGKSPKEIGVFKNTFYEKVPGIEHLECKKFWQELFFRFSFYLSTLITSEDLTAPTDVVLFQEFALSVQETLFTQDIVSNSFWKMEWFKKQSAERYGNLIVSKPIVRISPEGDFATSPVLLGDSLNQFVEEQLLGYSNRSPYLNLPNQIFKDAFSEKFEDECIDLFRRCGYRAGHILESGIWRHQNKDTDLSIPGVTLYGEIDVFACHPEQPIAFLVECKVLLDVRDSRSYQNVASKLNADSEGFRDKLRKKAKWLKEAFIHHYNTPIELYMFFVTDIPLPILGTNSEDIGVVDFNRLRYILQKISEALPGLEATQP